MYLDKYSDKAKPYLIAYKDEQKTHYKEFEAWVIKQRNPKGIKELMSDQGGEYIDSEFKAYLHTQGTVYWMTVYNTPEMNGCAKRSMWWNVEHT